jgi:cytochrome c2
MTRIFRFALPALLVPLLGVYGGWAAITVEDLPAYGVVRQPLNLTFTVRQHGVTKLSNLEPRVEARASGGAVAAAVAEPGKEQGQYTARLVLAEAGEWTITIHSGFGSSRVTLVPLPVIEPGAQAPTLAAADRGRRLFVAKGCVTCHLHRDVSGSGVVAVGPELTSRHLAPEYLRRFLADPAITGASNRMPNLNLKPAEIAALIAFLNSAERQTGGGAGH